MSQIDYIGSELELFAEAQRWKRYLRSAMTPYIRGRVLEVGAGIGAMTKALHGGSETSWTCLEPDPMLSAKLSNVVSGLPGNLLVVNGTLSDLPATATFDSILYVDVLEHIELDAAEVELAAQHLAPGGRLIVLCPAHQALYSPFDHHIGHYRRYDSGMFRALTPPGTMIDSVRYLDSAGFFLSLANRLLLRANMPTRRQVLIWDRLFVPISRLTDRLTGGRIGKSVLAVWARQ